MDPVFGIWQGQEVPLIVLRSSGGLTAALVPWGARLVSLRSPSRIGRMGEIVLGHDGLQDYIDHPTYFGATCGRYANRIAGGHFVLDGQGHQLDRNEGPNHLHGGRLGLDKHLWQVAERAGDAVRFQTVSPAGEMGYPGRLEVWASYRFQGDDRLVIEMQARTDAPTVVNLVNHAYFNLAGKGDVLDHDLTLHADFITPVTPDLLTTGEVRPLAGTAFDFRAPRTLRDALAGDPALPSGYDHNWCLRMGAEGDALTPCARLFDPASGRGLELATSEPGVQVYTCGMMPEGTPGRSGARYGRFAGITLETQKFPGSPNHLHFPSARLDPGRTYRHVMDFRFFTA